MAKHSFNGWPWFPQFRLEAPSNAYPLSYLLNPLGLVAAKQAIPAPSPKPYIMNSMISFSQKMKEEMCAALASSWTGTETEIDLAAAAKAIQIAHHYIKIVKAELGYLSAAQAPPFANKEEEVIFFKELKPWFLSQLYFYSHVHNIISNWPIGTQDIIKEYLEKELLRIHDFFQQHRELYIYLRNEANGMDDIYFRRADLVTKLSMGLSATDLDEEFSTGFDSKFAMIMANERLHAYLSKQLERIDGPTQATNIPPPSFQNLTWSASKTSMVELIYALHCSGALNQGQASIKEIAQVFERSFNINLSDIYHVYLEIKMRKKGYAPFLGNIKSNLEKQIEGSF
jgi:hypothetical protein